MNYKRGDVIETEKQRAREYGVKRGEAIEEMFNTKGWEYLKEFLEKMIENHKQNIENMILQRVEQDKLIDATILVRAYQFLLKLPEEFIKSRDNILKSKGGNTNGR